MCWGSLSLRLLTILVVPASVPRVLANDTDDDHVIAAAAAARAELIVTGDRKHLLPIGTHQGSPSSPSVRWSTASRQDSRFDTVTPRTKQASHDPCHCAERDGSNAEEHKEDEHDLRANLTLRTPPSKCGTDKNDRRD
jgi:hypothetical protein